MSENKEMGQYFSKEWTEDVTTGSPEAPEVEKSPNESTPIQKFSENLEKMYEDFKSQNDSLQIQVETQRRECSQRIEEERNLATHEVSQTHEKYQSMLEKEKKENNDIFNTKIRELENQNKVLDYDLKEMTKKNMQNESTLQRITEEKMTLVHELQNKKVELKRILDEKNNVDQLKDQLLQEVTDMKLNLQKLFHEKVKLEGDRNNPEVYLEQFESMSQELKDKKELTFEMAFGFYCQIKSQS